jgi:FMN phosphatase YigB (HAD superfamily)
MNIILDFNRTLFDPETAALLPDALELLQDLHKKGHTLHLISRLEPGRETTLESLGIQVFFTSIAFVDNKEKPMAEVIKKAGGKCVYVIGDHLYGEIRIGNRLGAKTIWLKRGRFAGLMRTSLDDEPWRTVEHLKEIKELI